MSLRFKGKEVVFDYVMVEVDGTVNIHRAWFADQNGEPQGELSDSELIALNRENKQLIEALKGDKDVQH